MHRVFYFPQFLFSGKMGKSFRLKLYETPLFNRCNEFIKIFGT